LASWSLVTDAGVGLPFLSFPTVWSKRKLVGSIERKL